MKKHLDVLLALVTLVGLINGLAGGARGGAAAEITGETSKAGGASGLHGSASSSGASNSTSGPGNGAGGGSVGGASAGGGLAGSPGGSVDAKSSGKPSNGGNSTLLSGGTSSSGPSNTSSGPSVGESGGGRGTSDATAGGTSGAPGGSNSEPGSNLSTSRTPSGGSGFREGRNSGPGAPSSAGNRNGGGSGLSGTTPGSVSLGSGLEGLGLGSSLVGVDRRGGASGGEGGRLGEELFAGGLGFPNALGGSSDYSGDEEHDFPASGSLSGSSGLRRGGRNGGFSAGTPGFGAFGSPVTGTSIDGVGGRAGVSARGRGPLGRDQLSDERLEFGRSFGRSGDSSTRPGNRFPGNSFSRWSSGLGEQGFYGDFRAASSGENFNGGTCGIGGCTPGFGAFGSVSGTDFSSHPSGFRFPEGLDGITRSNGISSGGGDEAFPGSYPRQSPGSSSDSDTGPDGSPGWPTRKSFTDFGSNGLDSSPGLSSPVAPASGVSGPSRLWPRLLRGGRGGRRLFGLRDRLRKPDPRFAAAVALRTLTRAAAISRLGVRIAAAIHANRRKAQAGFGGHRRGCIGRGCDRERRLHEGLRVADDILTRIPLNFDRLY